MAPPLKPDPHSRERDLETAKSVHFGKYSTGI
jgi:hypothetical protein